MFLRFRFWLWCFPQNGDGFRFELSSIQISEATSTLGSHPMLLTHEAFYRTQGVWAQCEIEPALTEKLSLVHNRVARNTTNQLETGNRFDPFPALVTPSQTLIGVFVSLLTLLAGLGILHSQRARGLRGQLTQNPGQYLVEGPCLASPTTQGSATPGQVASTEVEREKVDLGARLHDYEVELTKLVGRIEQIEQRLKADPSPSPTNNEGGPGIRGKVLAVNQTHHFVVLNLGARQGVEVGAEMLVLRGRTRIGKIRISSVEPATAIGDIITGSLARGVRVQLGDTVIYVGTNS